MAQLMPLPLTVSCFSKIQIGFTFLVPAHLGSPGKRAVKRVCVIRIVNYKAKFDSVSFHFVGKGPLLQKTPVSLPAYGLAPCNQYPADVLERHYCMQAVVARPWYLVIHACVQYVA